MFVKAFRLIFASTITLVLATGCVTARKETAAQPPSMPNEIVLAEPSIALMEPAFPVASRLFATHDQYSPEEFAAYGTLAFRSLANDGSRERYQNICEGYISSIPSASTLIKRGIELSDMMVTVWPVSSPELVEAVESVPESQQIESCPDIVNDIDLIASLRAIKLAERTFASTRGLSEARAARAAAEFEKIRSITQRRGPFLIAWSPGRNIGKNGEPILVTDLSDVTTVAQATSIFQTWSNQIELKPELWKELDGWNLEKLRITLRLWADRYGPGMLEVIGLLK